MKDKYMKYRIPSAVVKYVKKMERKSVDPSEFR
jgi:hypothetical protein